MVSGISTPANPLTWHLERALANTLTMTRRNHGAVIAPVAQRDAIDGDRIGIGRRRLAGPAHGHILTRDHGAAQIEQELGERGCA